MCLEFHRHGHSRCVNKSISLLMRTLIKENTSIVVVQNYSIKIIWVLGYTEQPFILSVSMAEREWASERARQKKGIIRFVQWMEHFCTLFQVSEIEYLKNWWFFFSNVLFVWLSIWLCVEPNSSGMSNTET